MLGLMVLNKDNFEKMCYITENLAKLLEIQLTVISPFMTIFHDLKLIFFQIRLIFVGTLVC